MRGPSAERTCSAAPGTPAPPLAGRDRGKRMLLGYAMDQLVRQLEEAFAARGVRIGLVVNASLALCRALGRQAGASERLGCVLAGKAGYSLFFTRDGEMTFHRFRAIGDLEAGNGDATLIARDLRLTRDFLGRETEERPPHGFVVAAPAAVEEHWLEWVSRAFEVDDARLGADERRDFLAGPDGDDPLAARDQGI